MQDRQRPAASHSPLSTVLALLGVAGLVVVVVMTLMPLFGVVTAATLAGAIYLAGVAGLIILTSGTQMAPLPLWALRLAVPLSGSLIAFWAMTLFG